MTFRSIPRVALDAYLSLIRLPADGVAIGRTHREAPEIDGVVRLVGDVFARPGAIVRATVTDVEGPDLEAKPVQ